MQIRPQQTLIATVGLSAPTIRWHNGTFYIICTNNSHNADGSGLNMRNFYVTTNDIWAGHWSDPIFYDFQGIDPSLFFDDDGRAYVQGCWREGSLTQTRCTIRQLEIDIATGKPLSETRELWKGWAGKNDAEGPHLYKKDGFYFLVTAEGGTFEQHMICIARSKNLWGPYESHENNPILTAFGTNQEIQNTGHGELFQDNSGAWWCTCLGVRADNGRYPLGRETFLAPVSWPKGGWPKIENPAMRVSGVTAHSSEVKTVPGVEWLYIRDPNLEDNAFSSKSINLVPRKTTLSAETGTTSFVGQRQRSLNCVVTVKLNKNEDHNDKPIQAGLTIYKEDIRHAEIYYDYSKSLVCFNKEMKLKGKPEMTTRYIGPGKVVAFQIRAEPDKYAFEYRTEEDLHWLKLGSMDSLDMTGCDFTGPVIGVFGCSEDESLNAHVVFKDFRISN